MEIKFEKVKNLYVAEFEATGDFNLHIERVSDGRFLVHQKSVAGGEYDIVDTVAHMDLDHKAVIDLDFTALVYPKWIKVVSATQPTKASVISNGEISPSGGGGGRDEWRYYIVGNVASALSIGFLVGVDINGVYGVTTSAAAYSNIANWKTIAVNYDAKFSIGGTAPASLNEMLASEGMTRQELEAAMEIVEITEEQFYNYQ